MKDDKKKLLLRIKKALPYGGIQTLAKKFDMDRDSISAILLGKWKNESVVEAAVQMIEDDLKEKKAIIKAVAKAA